MPTIQPSKETHGPGRLEHTLCGLAPEAFESGDHEESVRYAMDGELVTCKICRAELDHMRKYFKRYRYTGD